MHPSYDRHILPYAQGISYPNHVIPNTRCHILKDMHGIKQAIDLDLGLIWYTIKDGVSAQKMVLSSPLFFIAVQYSTQ